MELLTEGGGVRRKQGRDRIERLVGPERVCELLCGIVL